MKISTKHGLAQRLLALLGIALFVGPYWLNSLDFIPLFIQLLGWLIAAFATFSAVGIGPWGRYYSTLCVLDHQMELKKLEPKQPWQTIDE